MNALYKVHLKNHRGLVGFRLLFIIAFCGQPLGLMALSLTERSPFIPENFSAEETAATISNAATTPDNLKFKGMYKLGETYYFLVSSDQQPGKWITSDSSVDEVSVKQFNQNEEKLLIEYQGKSIWLDLVETASLSGAAGVSETQRTASTTRVTNRSSLLSQSRSGSRGSGSSSSYSIPGRRPSSSSTSRSDEITNAVSRYQALRNSSMIVPRPSPRKPPENLTPAGTPPPVPGDGSLTPPTDVPTFIPEPPDMSNPDKTPFN